jgi:hypothetical protein
VIVGSGSVAVGTLAAGGLSSVPVLALLGAGPAALGLAASGKSRAGV